MKNKKYLGIVVAVVLAYLFAVFVPIIWVSALAALPLILVRKRYALISGFVIGLLAPMSIYLFYPLPVAAELSGIVTRLASIPTFLVIVGFPLFYGIIMGLSGLFWAGLAENIRMKGLTPSPKLNS